MKLTKAQRQQVEHVRAVLLGTPTQQMIADTLVQALTDHPVESISFYQRTMPGIRTAGPSDGDDPHCWEWEVNGILGPALVTFHKFVGNSRYIPGTSWYLNVIKVDQVLGSIGGRSSYRVRGGTFRGACFHP